MEIRIRTGSASKRWRSTTRKKHYNTADNEFATDNISYLSINSLEFLDPVVKGQDLCGTDKGEVQRVEEEDQILPQVIARKKMHLRTRPPSEPFPLSIKNLPILNHFTLLSHLSLSSLNSPFRTAVLSQ
jgi:hypothetical protein